MTLTTRRPVQRMITRQRIPLSVRFQLRPPKPGKPYANPHPLQVRLCVNGEEGTRFGAIWEHQKLMVDPADWNVQTQRSRRRSDEVNRLIDLVRGKLIDLYEKQARDTASGAAPAPTTFSVKWHYQFGQPPAHDAKDWQAQNGGVLFRDRSLSADMPLGDAFAGHYADMLPRLSESDADRKMKVRWLRTMDLLKQYVTATALPLPTAANVTLAWVKRFHGWISLQPAKTNRTSISAEVLGEAAATRHVGRISQVLQMLVEEGILSQNVARLKAWPRYATKPIQFLEPEQVRALFALRWQGTADHVLWWFLLMCCTGLDYPDVVAYAKDRASLEQDSPLGRKLIGQRKKPPHEPYELFLLDEVDALFARYPQGPPAITSQALNRYTALIESELGVTWRITAKTARKTFGGLMLAAGYRIGEISRMLGHARISTTEQHYVKALGSAVDRARQRVGYVSIL